MKLTLEKVTLQNHGAAEGGLQWEPGGAGLQRLGLLSPPNSTHLSKVLVRPAGSLKSRELGRIGTLGLERAAYGVQWPDRASVWKEGQGRSTEQGWVGVGGGWARLALAHFHARDDLRG